MSSKAGTFWQIKKCFPKKGSTFIKKSLLCVRFNEINHLAGLDSEHPGKFAVKQPFCPLHNNFIGAAQLFASFGKLSFAPVQRADKVYNIASASAFKQAAEAFSPFLVVLYPVKALCGHCVYYFINFLFGKQTSHMGGKLFVVGRYVYGGTLVINRLKDIIFPLSRAAVTDADVLHPANAACSVYKNFADVKQQKNFLSPICGSNRAYSPLHVYYTTFLPKKL